MSVIRNKAFVFGAVPFELQSELTHRDILVDGAPDLEALNNFCREEACRAVIYYCSRPLYSRSRRDFLLFANTVVPEALRRGVAVLVVVDHDDAELTGRALIADELGADRNNSGQDEPGRFRPRVIDAPTAIWSRIAQDVLAYNPQRPLRSTILQPEDRNPAELEPGEEVTSEVLLRCPTDTILIQRAFSDFPKVRVGILLAKGGGDKSRNVYQVWPEVADGPEPVPFILKAAGSKEAKIELGNTELACDECTPFPYVAPLERSRIVTIDPRTAIVSHFVERATLLEDYIRYNSPALAIASIFDGPLRGWRANMTPELLNVGKYARKRGLVSTALALKKAYTGVKRKTSSPSALVAKVRALKDREVAACRSHGDLHLKNVFVRENSVEIVLIDFNRAGQHPASKDPAELEVSLAFSPAAHNEEAIPETVIRRLYSGSLLSQPDLGRRAHPRALAIEQVRRQIAGTIKPTEYREMVAVHCLWYARNRNDSLAYEIADRLL